MKTAITDLDDDIWVGLGRVTKRSITPEELGLIESALILYHKPKLNGVGVGRWTGNRITISSFDIEDCENYHDLEEEFTLPNQKAYYVLSDDRRIIWRESLSY